MTFAALLADELAILPTFGMYLAIIGLAGLAVLPFIRQRGRLRENAVGLIIATVVGIVLWAVF